MASSTLTVIQSVEEIREFIRVRRRQDFNTCIAFVPTMGALHEGHLELVRRARTEAGSGPSLVLVSIFVNPLQFGPNEDFARYPRTLAQDLAKLEGLADVVFTPNMEEFLGPQNRSDAIHVSAGAIGKVLEGLRRPMYFDGVLTIVAKLFNVIGPDLALFGQKDAQQLFAIQQMTTRLNFPIRIIPVETHREPDGLAMSSRNTYLRSEQRKTATSLWKSLEAGKKEAERGENLAKTLEAAKATFLAESGGKAKLDYLVAVEKCSFRELDEEEAKQFRGEALLLIAAFVGSTRLIDNLEVQIE